MTELFSKPLFILELANNHMGDPDHGIDVIRAFNQVCEPFRAEFNFAYKFQYRDLDTFIHPDYKSRTDIKYIKRFSETRLKEADFIRMKNEIKQSGHFAICTPFDEASVETIERQGFDAVKIASCSFTDWPLIERIGKVDKPVIASTAGVTLEEIDNIVGFFSHRKRQFTLMHCIAEYPTPIQRSELNQIDLLQKRYPNVQLGFSTHEDPTNIQNVKMAIAKGVRVFEKHIGVATDKYALNAYSATPAQVGAWLQSAKEAFAINGGSSEQRIAISKEERDTLRALGRAVFAKTALKKGDKLSAENIFFAIPSQNEQLLANDLSKYMEFRLTTELAAGQAVFFKDVESYNHRDKIYGVVQEIKKFIKESHISVPQQVELEISHHYGIDKMDQYGATLINYVNREYCKKVIIMLPGQTHPEQYHKLKEETFHVIKGSMTVTLDGQAKEYFPGDILLVTKGTRHIMTTKEGVVFEEISSNHSKNDSFYVDEAINQRKDRKTVLTHWMA